MAQVPRQPSLQAGADLEPVSDLDLWKDILLLLSNEQAFETFFKEQSIDVLRIDYEMLIASRHRVVSRVLHQLGCSTLDVEDYLFRLKDGTERMRYDEQAISVFRFCDRYYKLIETIEKYRDSVDVTEIRKALRLEHKLA